MYRLRNMKNNLWQIHSRSGRAYEGSLEQIMIVCLKLKIHGDELSHAVVTLLRNGDDYAEFGVNRTFMYTMKDEKKAA